MTNGGNGRGHLGDGTGQWQAYCVTCAAMKGINGPHPADHRCCNSHPRSTCSALGHYISGVVGCSIHNGVLDQFGRCWWCELEKSTGVWHNSIALQDKIVN